jgi:uncharacterized membrane protein
MLRELIRALFMAGVPVAVTSYLLVWWALRSDYLDSAGGVDDVEKQFKALSASKSKKKKADKKAAKVMNRRGKEVATEEAQPAAPARKMNPVHNKWLSFGGGFYGVVALLTYMVVELGELRDFVARYDGFMNLLRQLNFNIVIELIIDAFTNFIVAIAWPVYWLGDIAGEYIWIWFAVAYGAYWAGAKLALSRHQRP